MAALVILQIGVRFSELFVVYGAVTRKLYRASEGHHDSLMLMSKPQRTAPIDGSGLMLPKSSRPMKTLSSGS